MIFGHARMTYKHRYKSTLISDINPTCRKANFCILKKYFIVPLTVPPHLYDFSGGEQNALSHKLEIRQQRFITSYGTLTSAF